MPKNTTSGNRGQAYNLWIKSHEGLLKKSISPIGSSNKIKHIWTIYFYLLDGTCNLTYLVATLSVASNTISYVHILRIKNGELLLHESNNKYWPIQSINHRDFIMGWHQANWPVVWWFCLAGLAIQRKVFFFIKKFSSNSLDRLWKPVAFLLYTFMKPLGKIQRCDVLQKLMIINSFRNRRLRIFFN